MGRAADCMIPVNTDTTFGGNTVYLQAGVDGSSATINGTGTLTIEGPGENFAQAGSISNSMIVASNGVLQTETNNQMTLSGSIEVVAGGELRINANGGNNEVWGDDLGMQDADAPAGDATRANARSTHGHRAGGRPSTARQAAALRDEAQRAIRSHDGDRAPPRRSSGPRRLRTHYDVG